MKRSKKIFKLILSVIIFISILNICLPVVNAQSLNNSVGTGNYIVMELEHDQVLYKHNSEKETNSSLLNRLMTCLITLEYQSVTNLVTPKKDSISRNEKFRLSSKEQYTIESLVKATMLGGADNTTVALAEHIATSEQDFVQLMNDKAKQFGMQNTFFANADGSPNELQHTTLLDMAIFMKNAMKNQQFSDILNLRMALWDNLVILNENKLLIEGNLNYQQGGVLGHFNNIPTAQNTSIYYVETGKADSLDTMRLIIIVSGTNEDNYVQTSDLLLENVVTNYKKDLLVQEGDKIFEIKVGDVNLNLNASSDVYCVMAKDVANAVQNKSYTFIEGYGPDVIKPPIAVGTILGTANYQLKDGSTIRFSIIAGKDVEAKKTTVKSFLDTLKEYKEIYLLVIGLIVLEGIILLIKLINSIIRKINIIRGDR